MIISLLGFFVGILGLIFLCYSWLFMKNHNLEDSIGVIGVAMIALALAIEWSMSVFFLLTKI